MKKVLHNGNETEFILTAWELIPLLSTAKYGLEDLTNDFEDEKACELLRREINLVNELTKLLNV